jgi:hypothetical protein
MDKDNQKELAKLARRRWAAEYRRKHPERVRATQERYWARRGMRELQEAENVAAAAAEQEAADGVDEND